MKLIILFLLFSVGAHAQIKTESVVTVSEAGKKPSETKAELLHEAILDSISRYSTELGINATEFKNKLTEKFNSYFEGFKERKLSQDLGKNYTKELSPEQRASIMAGLESHREEEFIRYARLERLLDSHAFKSLEKIPESQIVKGTIVLNLNRGRLEKFYKRLLSDDNKQYSKVMILPEINLIGMSWGELDIEKSTLFTDPILNSWSKWFTANQPSNLEEVIKCQDGCVEGFNNWLQIPQDEGMQVPELIRDSLWLKVLYHVRKVSFVPDINEWKFEWEGSLVLLDANTKLLLSSSTIPTQTRTWRGLDQKDLNSKLASALYRGALEGMTRFSKKIEESSRFNRLGRLVITGHKNIGDVLSLIELLRKEGSKLYLELKLDYFSQNEANLIYFYQGEEKSFTDLLSGVKELKSSHSYQVVNEYTGVHHLLRLIAE